MKKYIINIKVYVKHTLVSANSVEKRTAFACEYQGHWDFSHSRSFMCAAAAAQLSTVTILSIKNNKLNNLMESLFEWYVKRKPLAIIII